MVPGQAPRSTLTSHTKHCHAQHTHTEMHTRAYHMPSYPSIYLSISHIYTYLHMCTYPHLKSCTCPHKQSRRPFLPLHATTYAHTHAHACIHRYTLHLTGTWHTPAAAGALHLHAAPRWRPLPLTAALRGQPCPGAARRRQPGARWPMVECMCGRAPQWDVRNGKGGRE